MAVIWLNIRLIYKLNNIAIKSGGGSIFLHNNSVDDIFYSLVRLCVFFNKILVNMLKYVKIC